MRAEASTPEARTVREAPREESRTVVLIALAGNLAIAVSKFIAASLTGSAAMASEGVHSLADTANELLLLYGMRRARVPPDTRHPFGHGREAYFWSFVVALLIFALGAGVSFYQGWSRLKEPHPLGDLRPVYVVIAVAFVVEGISWLAALRRMRRCIGALGWYGAIRRSKDPSVFTVLLEDSAALVGLLLALAGTVLADVTGNSVYDACGSLAIAALLCLTSFVLARETKALLIGEPAEQGLQDSILDIASRDPDIAHANGVITVQLGPDQVIATLSAEFQDALCAPGIEASVERLESAIKACHPQIVALFIKPQTREVWSERRAAVNPATDD